MKYYQNGLLEVIFCSIKCATVDPNELGVWGGIHKYFISWSYFTILNY